MEEVLQDPNIPEENTQEMKSHMTMLKEMISALENYPSKNLEVLEANRTSLNDALLRFDKLTEAEK